MSKILDAVKAGIPEYCYDFKVSNVASYAYFTTVKTSRLGLSTTISDDRIFEVVVKRSVKGMGHIQDLGLREIISWTDSNHGLERSFALAAINSCIPLQGKQYFSGNALDLAANIGKDKVITVIGHFPNMSNLKEAASEFNVLEKRPQEGDIPASEASSIIPKSDVVAMTGVTLLNDTIEELLSYKKPGATFIVLGSTVPLSPALFDFGVDVIGGAWVEDDAETIAKMSQGGTTRRVEGVKSVLLPKDTKLLNGFNEIMVPKDFI